ncbi:EutN/CcmL family microcompartment protein [bacterium]|nr:EutN/CcmL family microcompartment protein [bacterium]
MILGRVVGSFWCTAQHKSFDGRRLVLIVPWDALSEETKGSTIVAVDTVGCRTGDVITLLYEGSGARQVLADKTCPAEAVVVGIVDRIDIDYTDN